MLQITAAIESFEVLAQIAEDNRITDTLWAAASHVGQPRIAELRQINRLVRSQAMSQDDASATIRRTCTVDKLYKLYRGLSYLLGEEIMDHEVTKVIAKEKDPKKRLFLLLSLIQERDYGKTEKLLTDILAKTKAKHKVK